MRLYSFAIFSTSFKLFLFKHVQSPELPTRKLPAVSMSSWGRVASRLAPMTLENIFYLAKVFSLMKLANRAQFLFFLFFMLNI
jgi:hypothetical protein